MRSEILAAVLFPLLAIARTDLSGCTSSISGPSLIWYVPGSCELCDIPDCGGGRAPPKTDNPACPNYSGTATYSPSFLTGCGGAAAATSKPADGGLKSAGAGPTTAATASATATASGSGSPVTSTITLIAANSSSSSSQLSAANSSDTLIAATTAAASSAATTEGATAAITTGTATTPSAAVTSASSVPTGGANIMSIGMNIGGLVVAAGMGAMAMF